MSAAECIRYIRERARTWPDAGGRLALLKMARELDSVRESIERAAVDVDRDAAAILHVKSWSIEHPQFRGTTVHIHDAYVTNMPKWLVGELDRMHPGELRLVPADKEPGQ